jgi:hypothetical protein
MEHLHVLAAASRAVGTPGHAAARQYLVDQIREVGLDPQVQTVPVHVRFAGAPGFSAGTVQNVIARIPGTSSTGAIAVNAHYDSGTTGPGASDCGSCVVTALETMRALLAGPPLRNDVLFVFTDAEENGDLGAAAFVQDHPWARDVRLAINYEAQGSGGPAFLYATSEDDGWIVSEFLRVAPQVSAYSWMGAITERYPAGQLECDLAEYMKAGIPGVGFVYLSETPDYHTARDNVERIDLGSVQQEGDYTVAFVRHLGNADLTAVPRADNRIFFNVLPGLVAHYPYGWATPLAVLITVLVLALLAVGLRRGQIRPGRLLGAVGTLALGTLVILVLAVLAWIVIKRMNPAYQVVLIGIYQTELFVVALISGVVALLGVLYVLVRRVGTATVLAAILVVWLPLLWLMSLTLPAMSYLATWPLLFGLLPLGTFLVLRGHVEGRWAYVIALGVAAAPALVLLPATLYQAVGLLSRFEGATGLPLLGAAMVFVVPPLLLLLPHLDYLAGPGGGRRWIVPGVAALLSVLLIGWGTATASFDGAHPRPNHIAYVLDADADAAQWVSFDRHLDHWTGQFFPDGTVRTGYETVNWGTFQAFMAPAPTVDLLAPAVTIERDTVAAGLRTVDLRVASPRGAPEMRVRVEAPGAIRSATLDGRPLDLSAYDWAREGMLRLNYVNIPAEGARLTLTVATSEPITLTVEDSTLDLPATPAFIPPPRPRDTMPAPLYRRDATEVRRTFGL